MRSATGGMLLVAVVTGCSSSSSPGSPGLSDSPGPSASGHHRQPIGFNPPGPPGPTVPDDVQPAVTTWWGLLNERSCQELVTQTSTAITTTDEETDGLRAAAHIYRAAGEVCLGELNAAAGDATANVGASGWTDCTGQPVLLKHWVKLMIRARGGDGDARRALRSLPEPAPCASESPPSDSPSDTPSDDSESPSPSVSSG
ncbi:MAG: hypothetical protein QOJ03_351 [Frankiaceae bacterium]|nr:hypothetical protein [Frankiaceae bacterium]